MPRERRTREVRITRQAVTEYQRLVDVQADKAAAYVRRALDAYMREHPDASVATVRKWLFELMQAALPSFTELSETLSCDFMEELADRYGWTDVQPQLVGSTDYQLVNKRLHYLAGHLADGDPQRFKDEVTDVTRYFVRRAAQDSMVANCERAHLRYARVPSGLETCAFCFMLASRGFAYRSEESAGKRHQFHNRCTCTIVPGAEGRTKIDGYDPQTMYRNWKACAETVGVPTEHRKTPWTDEERKAVLREVETRDWHWLYTGEAPKVTYESPALKRDTLKNRPQEARTADRLRTVGIRCHFTKDGEKAGKDANGRQLWNKTADLPNGIELKTVMTSKNAYGAVKNYFDKSIGKKGMRRLIIDNGESKYLEDVQIIKAVQELVETYSEYREQFTWVSVFGKDGKLVDVIS